MFRGKEIVSVKNNNKNFRLSLKEFRTIRKNTMSKRNSFVYAAIFFISY